MERLVTKGFKQKYKINYKEIFAPIARLSSMNAFIIVLYTLSN